MEQIRTRLAELKHEYELGEHRLRELMQQEAGVRETLLRISGAIQVLEELLAGDAQRDLDRDLDRDPDRDLGTGLERDSMPSGPEPAVLRVP